MQVALHGKRLTRRLISAPILTCLLRSSQRHHPGLLRLFAVLLCFCASCCYRLCQQVFYRSRSSVLASCSTQVAPTDVDCMHVVHTWLLAQMALGGRTLDT
jgi:hypothetical protein